MWGWSPGRSSTSKWTSVLVSCRRYVSDKRLGKGRRTEAEWTAFILSIFWHMEQIGSSVMWDSLWWKWMFVGIVGVGIDMGNGGGDGVFSSPPRPLLAWCNFCWTWNVTYIDVFHSKTMVVVDHNLEAKAFADWILRKARCAPDPCMPMGMPMVVYASDSELRTLTLCYYLVFYIYVNTVVWRRVIGPLMLSIVWYHIIF